VSDESDIIDHAMLFIRASTIKGQAISRAV